MNTAWSGVMSKAFWVGAALICCPIALTAQANVALNPAYKRAQGLVNDGNAVAGRALVDSMIAVAAPGSNDYAEGVYWRAVLAATAADAEMDYRRIVVDYPLSPRVEDALIRLAQLELARGNYDNALKHLGRLASEHPDSPARARAGYWAARAYFDKNDVQGGCASLSDALGRTTDSDAELRNQINYLNQRCAGVVLATPGAPQPVDSAAVASVPPQQPVQSPPAAAAPAETPVVVSGVDSVKAPVEVTKEPIPKKTEPIAAPPVSRPAVEKPPARQPAEPEKKPASTGKKVYSVQIAAYNVKSQAEAMVLKLKKSGYEARVDGAGAPFRVRIGKYATSAQAGAVQRSLKAKHITGFVVQADNQ
jgi:cell division protein FtsN